MNLREYLFVHEMKISELAKKINYDRCYLNEIVKKRKIPGRKLAQLIEFHTNGQVTVKELLTTKQENAK